MDQWLTITDYSIHYFAPLNLLIATMRYTGSDYERDMEGIKESEATRRWWKVRWSGTWVRDLRMPVLIECHAGQAFSIARLVRVENSLRWLETPCCRGGRAQRSSVCSGSARDVR